MPSFWLHVKSHVAQRLTSASGVKVTPDDLVAPPRPELGDLAFGCFKVAKTLGKNPAEAAKDVVAKFGSADAGKGKALMLEYAQPNTHKEMHVGHLRNLVLGASLVKILSHAGWKVIPASYHGDVGAHVAKCLWWFVEKSRDNGVGTTSPESETKKSKKKIVDEKRSAAMGLSEKEVDAFLAAVPREKKTGKYLGEIYTQASREDLAEV